MYDGMLYKFGEHPDWDEWGAAYYEFYAAQEHEYETDQSWASHEELRSAINYTAASHKAFLDLY